MIEDHIDRIWFNYFFSNTDKLGIQKKRSQYVVFDHMQKWNIEDNLIMYENINDSNKKNIENLIDESLNLEENKFFMIQYFSLNEKEFTKTTDKLKKYLDLAKIQMREKCLALNKNYKYIKDLNDRIDISDKYKDAFEELLFQDKLISLKKDIKNHCLESSYTFLENKKVKKFNVPILSIIISLFIVLSIYFISSLYNVYKKR